MLNTTSSPSLSDIAAVTGNEGFGGNSGWWILIILFAIFGGWGNQNANNSSSNSGAMDNYVLNSDFATLERKIDGVNNGLCDGFYAQNTNQLNGFSSVNSAVSNGFSGVNNAVCTLGYQNAQLINGLESTVNQGFYGVQTNQNAMTNQLQQSICQLRYDLSQQNQAIMQNDNNNYRALHDEMIATQMAAKDEKIAEQASQIQALNLAASQAAQNSYLISQLRPAAVPAYTVANPYSTYGLGCSCNS